MKTDLSNILVPPEISILQAIKAIDAGSIQIAVVVDEAGKLLGTVTDGDIRRGLLRGVSLEQPVRLVMNGRPQTLDQNYSREAAVDLMHRLALHQLPVVDADGKVLGIEIFDDLVRPADSDAWVVLMAGGLGTRLMPLTENLPKPMIPVGGRPLIETIIRNFETQGFRNIYLSVNYKSEVIRDHFGDGRDFGVSIEYLVEDRRLGTAGALSLLPKRPPGRVIVMNGDLLTSVNFRHLLEFHAEQRALATMCVREYAIQVPYGVVETDGLRLKAVIEKPTQKFFVNAGVYALEPEVFDLIPKDEFFDMPQLFDRIVANGGASAVFPIHEYWLDIGRIDDLERARGDIGAMFDK